jgi:hydrogenase nickel incorporation protein HypA/HybF
MHEMGIACSILEAVQEKVRIHPGHRASRVGLRIGEFAGVDPESLRFCFEAMDSSCPLAVEIDWRRAADGCRGDELEIAWFELEKIPEPAEVVP